MKLLQVIKAVTKVKSKVKVSILQFSSNIGKHKFDVNRYLNNVINAKFNRYYFQSKKLGIFALKKAALLKY